MEPRVHKLLVLHVLLLASLLSGVVVLLEPDNEFHPECPKHLLKPLEYVAEHLPIEKVEPYAVVWLRVWLVRLVVRLGVVPSGPLQRLHE